MDQGVSVNSDALGELLLSRPLCKEPYAFTYADGTRSLDLWSDRPLYQQIADELRLRITQGGLGSGRKLPSERTLSERHGTSRLTARRALQVLIAEGLAEPRRGVGSSCARQAQSAG